MKLLLLIAALVIGCVACVAQDHKSVPNKPLDQFQPQVDLFQFTSAVPSAKVVIYPTGDKPLIEEWDEKGDLVLTVMRDGSVKSAKPLDQVSADFWKIFAKTMPEFCAGAGGGPLK
jgi:hypothetical protein